MLCKGIFWITDMDNVEENKMIYQIPVDNMGNIDEAVDRTTLNSKNQDNLNHKKTWESLNIKETRNKKFDYYPRGRVEISRRKAIIYATPSICTEEIMDYIKEKFELTEENGYMYIDCLWVSGSLKGHGYSTDLLTACIEDSKEKGKKGLCILCAAKKKPFLADPKFLKYKGFTVADEADNGIQLWYLPFDKKADTPRFKECAKHPHIKEKGYVLYYTSQCPFNAKYVPILEQSAKENDILFRAIHIESRDEAQNAPTPITNYALFHDGEYVTNEQMNDKKFLKLVNG